MGNLFRPKATPREKSNFTTLELGRVLVRFNHIAGRIVNANHGVRVRSGFVARIRNDLSRRRSRALGLK